MVFETVVSSQLNKFLGNYIENLNSSQLKLGLLGGKTFFACFFFRVHHPKKKIKFVTLGDVVLKHLKLKQSALDDLNLPVKTIAGHIGELVLKIPWTNLYAARTHVSIKGVYLLAVPNQAVSYDSEKEKAALKDAKNRQLAVIEEAKIREVLGNERCSPVFVVIQIDGCYIYWLQY